MPWIYTDGGLAPTRAKYEGDTEGKAQYKLYILEDGTLIETSNTEAKNMIPSETKRLTARIETAVFDKDEGSIGLKIVNTEPTDADGDLGSVEIS